MSFLNLKECFVVFNVYDLGVAETENKEEKKKYNVNHNIDYSKEYLASEIEDKQYPKGSVVAVFDLDTICYPVSTMCDEKWIETFVFKKNRKFKNRTELQRWCEVKSVDYKSLEIKDCREAEPVANCLSSIKKSIERLIDEVGATHAEFYLGGSGNFRLDLPLPVRYKSNRDNHIRPTHLQAAQEYVIRKYDAKKIKNIECDDFVSIRTISINKQEGVKGICITTDKDQLQTFTDEMYVYRGGKEYHLNSELGELWFEKASVKGTGLKWLLNQALVTGDSTDEYLPRRHFNKKYGAKSYYNDVNEIDNVKELLQFIVNKWRSLVGETCEFNSWDGKFQLMTWLELAELYFSAAYMKTKIDDDLKFEDLLIKYDVEY